MSPKSGPTSTTARLAAMLLLLCAFLAATPAPPAAAQALPLVPNPVTTSELMKYAEMLGLSVQQRMNLLAVHDQYKERYRQFEDRDIRELQDQLINIVMRFIREQFRIPERTEIEELVKQYERVLEKANGVDRTLFDSMAGMLTEEQLLDLERARTARELAIYREVVSEFAGEFSPASGVDLSDMTQRLPLGPEAIAQTDPILFEYEAALLRKTRTMYGILKDAVTLVLDTIDQLGLRGMDQQEMIELMQDEEIQQSLAATFDEASKPFQETAYDLSQHNFRTLRRLLNVLVVLEPKQAETLRHRYCRRAYSEFYRGAGEWRDRYDRALQLQTLSPDKARAVQMQRGDFVRQDDVIVDSMMTTIEALRKYRTVALLSEEERDPRLDKLDELNQRRETLNSNAIAALDAILGPELVAILDQEEERKEKGQRQVTIAMPGGQRTVIVDDNGEAIEEPTGPELIEDPNLPLPITVDDANALADSLGWGEDDRVLLMSVFGDYRAKFDRLRIKPVPAEGEEEKEPTPRERAKMLSELFDRLRAADEAFFDDAALLVTEDAQQDVIKRHRSIRLRAVSNKVTLNFTRGSGDEEAYVDLIVVLQECGLIERRLVALRPLMDQYENTVTPAVNDRLATLRDGVRKLASIETLRQREGEAAQRAAENARDKWIEAWEAVRKANKEIVKLNRRALEQIANAMPDADAWDLRYAYNRAAFPDIFDQDESAEKYFAAAMELPDITSAQRDRISDILYDYRSRYFTLSQRMTELRKQRDFDPSNFQMPQREDIEREIENERLDFDREELGDRARMRLRLVLTDEQAKQIPDLERWRRGRR